MSLNRSQLTAEIAANYPDNTSNEITPADLRQTSEDVLNYTTLTSDVNDFSNYGGSGSPLTNLVNPVNAGDAANKSYVDSSVAGVHGIPSGGTTDQVLGKNSNTNYDVSWQNPSEGGIPSIKADSNTPITTAVTLSSGTNITLSQTGADITINASAPSVPNLQNVLTAGNNANSLKILNIGTSGNNPGLSVNAGVVTSLGGGATTDDGNGNVAATTVSATNTGSNFDYVTVLSGTNSNPSAVSATYAAPGIQNVALLSTPQECIFAENIQTGEQFIACDGTNAVKITGNVLLNEFTPNAALMTDSGSNIAASSTTDTELGYVHGVTSPIQTQLNAALISPMTTLGDTMYENASPAAARLPGNTTTTNKFLSQTGTGSVSAAPGWNTIVGSDLPNPSASTLGGVQSKTSVSHQWINSISTSGVPASSQPAFTDISGSVSPAQLPNPSASTLGGVQSAAAVSHEWINSISTSGVPALSQPAFTDVSGSVASTQMPALTGDVTSTAGTVATTIAAGAVSLTKMANLSAHTLIGNNTGSAATPIALTVSQVNTLLGTPVPGGANTDVQFNSSGTFGGSSALTTNGTGGLTATGTIQGATLTDGTATISSGQGSFSNSGFLTEISNPGEGSIWATDGDGNVVTICNTEQAVSASNGTFLANLVDDSNSCAGNFANDTIVAQICANTIGVGVGSGGLSADLIDTGANLAAEFTDGTNTLQICNTTQAIVSSGPNFQANLIDSGNLCAGYFTGGPVTTKIATGQAGVYSILDNFSATIVSSGSAAAQFADGSQALSICDTIEALTCQDASSNSVTLCNNLNALTVGGPSSLSGGNVTIDTNGNAQITGNSGNATSGAVLAVGDQNVSDYSCDIVTPSFAIQAFGPSSLEDVTLSGLFFPVQAPTGSAPSYVLGAMYFDTTLNKLRIGGASGWETVTSI